MFTPLWDMEFSETIQSPLHFPRCSLQLLYPSSLATAPALPQSSIQHFWFREGSAPSRSEHLFLTSKMCNYWALSMFPHSSSSLHPSKPHHSMKLMLTSFAWAVVTCNIEFVSTLLSNFAENLIWGFVLFFFYSPYIWFPRQVQRFTTKLPHAPVISTPMINLFLLKL